MRIALGIIAALSLLVSFVIFATAASAMQEIVAAVIGVNFTVALVGIGVLNHMDRIGVTAIEYMTKRVKSE
jgi:hypothetical protein